MAAHIISTHVPFANDVCMICTQDLSGIDLDRFPVRMACGHATLCLICAHSLLRKKGVKCVQCGELSAWLNRSDIRVNFELKKKLADFQNSVVADVIMVDNLPLSKLVISSSSPRVSTGITPTAAAAESVVESPEERDCGNKYEDLMASDEWATEIFGEESADEDESKLEIEAREYYKILYKSQYNAPLVELKNMIDEKTINQQSGLRWDTEAIRCAEKGSPYMMSILIKHGADISKTDRDGNTALMAAAKHSRNDNVKILLDAGANVNFESKAGITALMLAARNGCDSCVQLLVEGGANIEKRDQLGQTALIFASINIHVKCVKLLCDAGANADAQSRNGDTALIIATRWKSFKCMETLIWGGANIDIRNFDISPHSISDDGKTPLDIVEQHSSRYQDMMGSKCKQLLLDRTALLKKVSARKSFWRRT